MQAASLGLEVGLAVKAMNRPSGVIASVVSHKQLDLFSLIFLHSGSSATGLDPLQGLFAPAEFLEDRLHCRRPHEWLGVTVPSRQKLLNGLLQILDADKYSPANAFARQFTKPPLHEV